MELYGAPKSKRASSDPDQKIVICHNTICGLASRKGRQGRDGKIDVSLFRRRRAITPVTEVTDIAAAASHHFRG
jgi:hypothetical protein